MTALLLAAPDIVMEPRLVTGASAQGMIVLRRCVDAIELMAAAAAAPGAAIVLSAGVPRLSADVIARLRVDRPVVGLAPDGDDRARLDRLGVAAIDTEDRTAEEVLRAIAAAIRRGTIEGEMLGEEPASETGLVIAVWGPIGSPGRTTVAIGIADALSRSGHRVCLVDADTYAPSITASLGLIEDVSGLVVGCRQADSGRLTGSLLAAITRPVSSTWDVLGGLPSADRWRDVSHTGLDRLWTACRAAYDITIVDTGFCLESDDEAAWGRMRNAAALSAVSGADRVVVVGDASPSGVIRLAQAWPTAATVVGEAPAVVVRNRARGRDREWDRIIRRCGMAAPVLAVPADDRALAATWRHGRTLGESRRRSGARPALGEVAEQATSGWILTSRNPLAG